MKKLELLVRGLRRQGQKTVFLRVLEFYFFRDFASGLLCFSKNFAKNVKKIFTF